MIATLSIDYYDTVNDEFDDLSSLHSSDEDSHVDDADATTMRTGTEATSRLSDDDSGAHAVLRLCSLAC